MDKITDKIILLGFGMFLLPDKSGAARPVAAFLITVAAAALGSYIEEKKILYVLFAAVFLAALQNPAVLLFFPVFLYDMVFGGAYFFAAPMLVLFLRHLPESREKMVLWLLLVALAFVFAHKTMEKQRLAGELIRIRDDGVERNLMLKEKNRHLLEKQDYEIYLATLKERNRIAREIHDNVGHMLSRLILMTGALLTTEKEGTVYKQLLQMKDTLDLAMTSIRQSVHDLHEDSVDLKQAVSEIVETMEGKYSVELEYDMSKDIPGRVKYCLIATTKEAVSNIIKHSNGDKVCIRFREHPGFYRLSIEDNGTKQQIRRETGIGLLNMKERSASLGGTFQIYTAKGFCIFMTIPKQKEVICG